jgi:hypothetical protein
MKRFMSLITAAALAAVFISGCATVMDKVIDTEVGVVANASESSNLGLRSEIVARLDNATEIAKAGNDAQGAQCWAAGSAWVATLPIPQDATQADIQLPAAIGLSGAYETARIKAKALEARVAAGKAKIAALRAIVDAGIPESVVNACAVVVYDLNALKIKILGAIGLGALSAGL